VTECAHVDRDERGCVECRREKHRARKRANAHKRKPSTHCKKGHKLAGGNLLLVTHYQTNTVERRCRICNSARDKRRTKARSKGGVPSLLACSRDMVKTRRLLQLDEDRERAATWWERQEILEQRRRVEQDAG